MARNNASILDASELRQLASCIDASGTPEFPKEICEFCVNICGAETVFLSAFFVADKPAALYSNHTDDTDKDALNVYLGVSYLLDPFFELFRKKRGDQVVSLKQIAPDDFKRSEYYQKFYKVIRLQEECGLMLHLTDQSALFFSFGTKSKGSRIRPSGLEAILPVIAALVRRHWTVLSPEKPDGSGRMAAHLEAAFEAFGSSVLSPREGEVARMILKGHSSKAIARNFDNSPETIKVHRKRIYTKLQVASQGELLSLFLSALSKMPATSTGDPLAVLSHLD